MCFVDLWNLAVGKVKSSDTMSVERLLKLRNFFKLRYIQGLKNARVFIEIKFGGVSSTARFRLLPRCQHVQPFACPIIRCHVATLAAYLRQHRSAIADCTEIETFLWSLKCSFLFRNKSRATIPMLMCRELKNSMVGNHLRARLSYEWLRRPRFNVSLENQATAIKKRRLTKIENKLNL